MDEYDATYDDETGNWVDRMLAEQARIPSCDAWVGPGSTAQGRQKYYVVVRDERPNCRGAATTALEAVGAADGGSTAESLLLEALTAALDFIRAGGDIRINLPPDCPLGNPFERLEALRRNRWRQEDGTTVQDVESWRALGQAYKKHERTSGVSVNQGCDEMAEILVGAVLSDAARAMTAAF
ncbi:hypothetical protein [Methylocapsa aurea]|uniref:hypothetical protein n=1 Tax=Methylocapsa aurea TaxID=663610 RepID=UPI000564A262|nr:hypothetical protein [Methylocapsa aurea]